MSVRSVSKKVLGGILRPVVWLGRRVVMAQQFVVMFLSTAQYLLSFKVRPDDIFIVTYPRSGTTWAQMIVYQLLSDGEMDFEHISEKCPWLERLPHHNRLDAAELRSPRMFKSHLKYAHIPKDPNSRYIYVARDGLDVAISFHHHYKELFNYPKDFDGFFEDFLNGRVQGGKWSDHVKAWWSNSKDLNVLFLTFEEMKADLPKVVEQIADFCEVELDEQRKARVVERSGFSYMKAHEDKFEHVTEVLWEGNLRSKTGRFIREGKSGHGAARVTQEQLLRFQRATEDLVSETGLRFPSTARTQLHQQLGVAPLQPRKKREA